MRIGMTEFGREVWVLAAKRGITTQRDLARVMEREAGEHVSHDTLRNYLHGRTTVPPRLLKLLDAALHLNDQEKHDLAMVYAWGETVREASARSA